ncbi:MAG: glycosyltransferase family 4 protein [bacterium]|nr:glycosyltransferase family 4 protein [bacterium]
MKIILVHKFYFEHRGAERYLFDLEKLLTRKGHEVIPFALHHPHNKPSEYSRYFLPWVDVKNPRSIREYIRLLGRVIYSFEAKKYFERLIRDVRPDIVHIQNIYHHISPSILDVCRAYDIPVVQTVHDYKLICPNYKLFCNGDVEEFCKKSYWKEVIHRCVHGSLVKSFLAVVEMMIHKTFRLYEKGVDAFIAPSHSVAEKLIEYGMPANKIVVMPHFIHAADYEPSYTIGKYLVYVGSLSEEKGVDTLIRAAKDLPLPIKIIGDGPMRASLIALTLTRGVQKIVEFVGKKEGDELHTLIQGSAAVIVPSLWYEVFGYVVLESWALGKVVIASDRGSLPELVGHISKDLLFHAGDNSDLVRVVDMLIKDPKFLETAALKGRVLVDEKYTPKLYYQGLLDVYRSVISGK